MKKICFGNGKILNFGDNECFWVSNLGYQVSDLRNAQAPEMRNAQVSDLRRKLGLGFAKWKWLRRVNFGSGRGNLGLGFKKNLGDDELKKDGEKSR